MHLLICSYTFQMFDTPLCLIVYSGISEPIWSTNCCCLYKKSPYPKKVSPPSRDTSKSATMTELDTISTICIILFCFLHPTTVLYSDFDHLQLRILVVTKKLNLWFFCTRCILSFLWKYIFIGFSCSIKFSGNLRQIRLLVRNMINYHLLA